VAIKCSVGGAVPSGNVDLLLSEIESPNRTMLFVMVGVFRKSRINRQTGRSVWRPAHWHVVECRSAIATFSRRNQTLRGDFTSTGPAGGVVALPVVRMMLVCFRLATKGSSAAGMLKYSGSKSVSTRIASAASGHESYLWAIGTLVAHNPSHDRPIRLAARSG